MIAVNLIPPAVLAARRRSRRIRQWLVIVSVSAALCAVPVLIQLRQHARLVSLRGQKRQQEAEVATLRGELGELTRATVDLDRRIKRADALRTKRDWAGLLTLVVECMPPEVWLTAVTTEAPASRAPSRRGGLRPAEPAEQNEMVVMAGARQVALAGYAVQHEQLYDFMTRLKASNTFASVELVKAGMEPTLASQAVRFELRCKWGRATP